MKQLKTTQPENHSGERTKTTISVKNLYKEYDNGGVVAVDDVSFDIESGSVVGLLGPNGAGKTTLVKLMLGTLIPDDGTVDIHGKSVHENLRWAHQRIGMMFEGSRNAYFRLTVRENLEFFTRLNGIPAAQRRERHDELLQRLNLFEKADVPVRNLSRGMKQKVALASTLSCDVDTIFLDEPTLGLDVETSLILQDELRTLVNEQEMTVIITSHDMDIIENICDRVIILSNGNVIADASVQDLLQVFNQSAYNVRLEQPVSEVTLDSMAAAFTINEHRNYAGVEEFKITATDGDVHDVSDTLRSFDCSVQSFEMATPDLEDVFLEMTNE